VIAGAGSKLLNGSTFHASVFAAMRDSRAQINAGVQGAATKNATSVVAVMAKEGAACEVTDPSIEVEAEFFNSMVGESGTQVIREEVLTAIGACTGIGKIEELEAALKKIQQTDLFRFVDGTGQNCLVNSLTYVRDLKQGSSPNWGANPNDWTVSVKDALGKLCVTRVDGALLTGSLAATDLANLVFDKHAAKKVCLADLKEPVRFSWLLSPGDRDKVKAIRQELQETEKKTLANSAAAVAAPGKVKAKGGAASSSSGPPPAKKAKTELDLAMAMFGR